MPFVPDAALVRRACAGVVGILLGIALAGPEAGAEPPRAPALVQPAPAAPASPVADTSTVVGTWMGALQVGAQELRVVFNIERTGKGGLTGTMDSPDQGAADIPIEQVLLEADTLRLGIPSIAGRFAGIVADDGRSIRGQWAQGGRRLPLELERVDQAPAVERPQTPAPPYPYATRTVRFTNEAAGVTLEGTLTRPEGDGPVPAVVLVAGAGGQDRNGSVMGHEPLHVIADALTRRGVAVLRFDERGVGASGGSQRTATLVDLASDVSAAVDALAGRSGIDPDRLGVVGHSEGGLIATRVAVGNDAVDFVALLSTPALPGHDVLAARLKAWGEARSVDRRTRAIQQGTQQRLFNVLTREADSAAVVEDLRKILREAQGIDGRQAIEREVRRLMHPWFRFYLQYDPRPVLREVDVPVLAMSGAADRQVAPDTNLAATRHALERGANPPHTIRRLDSTNHYLQPVEGHAPTRYGRIEQTIDPEALDVLTGWVARQAGLDERTRRAAPAGKGAGRTNR
jgi:hypothetical protein